MCNYQTNILLVIMSIYLHTRYNLIVVLLDVIATVFDSYLLTCPYRKMRKIVFKQHFSVCCKDLSIQL